jgi:Dyp-type peroxidase family
MDDKRGSELGAIERHDIQGLAVHSFKAWRYGRYLLWHIGDGAAARGWLRARMAAGEITDACSAQAALPVCNVAFTHAGLEVLGLSGEALDTFDDAFVDGMSRPNRSRILGDIGPNDPSRWAWGGRGDGQKPVHVLQAVFATTPEALRAVMAAHVEAAEAAGMRLVAEPIEGRLDSDEREHFGFRDGVSQPKVRGFSRRADTGHPESRTGDDAPRDEPLRTGEILLGHRGERDYQRLEPSVSVAEDPDDVLPYKRARALFRPARDDEARKDLGRNGSYLVARQLAQDVAAFRDYAEQAARRLSRPGAPVTSEWVQAKMVGRWPSGAMLRPGDSGDPGPDPKRDGAERFADDPVGIGCPVGSHIRRSNPRDDMKAEVIAMHRIRRHGRLYGPRMAAGLQEEDGVDRGLFFVALNADIHGQFEFIQHTWLNNPYFEGRAGEVDPIAGYGLPGSNAHSVLEEGGLRCLRDIPRFVTVRGGAYFFLPSLTALRYLGSGMPAGER